jgi:hypothetical protein
MTKPLKTREEKMLTQIAWDQRINAVARSDNQAAAQSTFAALAPGAKIEFAPGQRTFTTESGETTVSASYETAAQGSVFQVPSAAALATALASNTAEAEAVRQIIAALPPIRSRVALGRMIAANAFAGLWTELDLDTEEGRDVALLAAQARRLPSSLRPYFGQAVAAADALGDDAARNVRQAVANIPALLAVLKPKELAETFGPDGSLLETLDELGLPQQIGNVVPAAVKALNVANVEAVGRIVAVAKSANSWPSRAPEQRRVIDALSPILADPDLPDGFADWVIRAVSSRAWRNLPGMERVLVVWAKRDGSAWNPAMSAMRAVADAIRWSEAQAAAAQKKRAKETALMNAVFPNLPLPFCPEDIGVSVTPLRTWGELVDVGGLLQNCLHLKSFADDCHAGSTLIVSINRIEAVGTETRKKVLKAKTLSAAEIALLGGRWVEMQHYGPFNSPPPAPARAALGAFINHLNSKIGG